MNFVFSKNCSIYGFFTIYDLFYLKKLMCYIVPVNLIYNCTNQYTNNYPYPFKMHWFMTLKSWEVLSLLLGPPFDI